MTSARNSPGLPRTTTTWCRARIACTHIKYILPTSKQADAARCTARTRIASGRREPQRERGDLEREEGGRRARAQRDRMPLKGGRWDNDSPGETDGMGHMAHARDAVITCKCTALYRRVKVGVLAHPSRELLGVHAVGGWGTCYLAAQSRTHRDTDRSQDRRVKKDPPAQQLYVYASTR